MFLAPGAECAEKAAVDVTRVGADVAADLLVGDALDTACQPGGFGEPVGEA